MLLFSDNCVSRRKLAYMYYSMADMTICTLQVAVKVIDKTKLDPVARGHLFQEVRCMKLVQNPNVVRLYEVIDTANKLYLILELQGIQAGQKLPVLILIVLRDLLQRETHLPETLSMAGQFLASKTG